MRSPGGLTRETGDERRHVDLTVVLVATDRRVRFCAVRPADGSLDPDAGDVDYADLASVSVDDGAEFAFTTTDGVTWRFPLPDDEAQAVDAARRHLQWVGDLRQRVVAAGNDVDLAAGQLTDHAADREWSAAEETYECHRDLLDGLVADLLVAGPDAVAHLAPELTDLDRTLERAATTLSVERATAQLTLAQQLVENEDLDQARKVLQRARGLHDRAQAHAEAVRRGDEFRFGEQRELEDELEGLSWQLATVAGEPIRLAHEAKLLAEAAEAPETAVDHWETAFRRYASVLTVDLTDGDRQFSGSPDAVRAEMEVAAAALVDGHRALAATQWNEGVSCHQAGDVTEALRLYDDAHEHLVRARDLAAQFVDEARAELTDRVDHVESALTRIRETATVDGGPGAEGSDATPPDAGSGAPTPDADSLEGATDASEREFPTIQELRDIDTATEITLGDEPERIGAGEAPDSGVGDAEDETERGTEPANGGEASVVHRDRPDTE